MKFSIFKKTYTQIHIYNKAFSNLIRIKLNLAFYCIKSCRLNRNATLCQIQIELNLTRLNAV